MKCVILAGGYGTRLSEETNLKPKPMVEIGNMPILWHIMKFYSFYNINEFIICCGYKSEVIKEFFLNYHNNSSNLEIDVKNNSCVSFENEYTEPWKVTLVDTGKETMTGGRLRRVKKYIQDENEFCFTYGDGLSNIDLKKLIDLHKSKGTLATLSAVFPPARFGALEIENDMVTNFEEKPIGDSRRINGGFFILSPKVIEYIEDDMTIWEKEPMKMLADSGNLSAYKHDGFWQPMDTLNDKNYLNKIWKANKAPWKLWK